MNNNLNAGINPRHSFVAPRIIVPASQSLDSVQGVVPLFIDQFGEKVAEFSPRISVGWTKDVLMIKVRIVDNVTTSRPELQAEHPDFWRQDHLELRLLRNPHRDLEQVQVILAVSGKSLVSGGAAAGEPISWQVERREDGWGGVAMIPWSALNITAPQSGSVLKGLIAHTRWGRGYSEITCCTPVQLGFSHSERFAEFVFMDAPADVALESIELPKGALRSGCNHVRVILSNLSGKVLAGELQLVDGSGVLLSANACRLEEGETEIDISLELKRPEYTHVDLAFNTEAGEHLSLGAVTLRAGVELKPSPATKNNHPYMLYRDDDRDALRRKSRLPFINFSNAKGDAMISREIPDSPDNLPLELTPTCGGWLRVVRESLLYSRDDARGQVEEYIQGRLSEATLAAARNVDRTVGQDVDSLQELLDGLNELLSQPDFYNADAFERIALPADTRETLEKRHDRLTARELFKHNRTVFQCAIECVREFHLDYLHEALNRVNQWLLEPDDRLLYEATQWLAAADECMITNPHIDLHTGGLSSGLAFAYDAVASHLTGEARVIWLSVLKRLLDLYLATARIQHWNCTTIANANVVCNGGGGLLALALLTEFPADAAEALRFARTYIWNWLDYCGGPNGGNTEGTQYWQYGTENFLPFALALERVLGSDDDMLSQPSIENAMNMIRVSLCNDGCLHGFNDTIPLPVGGNLAWFCASRYNDRFALWYGDHACRVFAARKRAGKETPYRKITMQSLGWRPELPEQTEQPEPLPTAMILEDIQYGILRSGTNWDCRWVAGFKGSRPPYTHHNQPDTGSFFVHLAGERLLIDPGYYKSHPTNHSLPLIDGQGPVCPAGWTGVIIACEQRGALRYLTIDSTAAYVGAAKRVVRHLVMVGNSGIVLLDDIVADGEITAQFQCGGPTHIAAQGHRLEISGERVGLHLDLVTRQDTIFELQAERSLKDTHWGYIFADCRHFPVTCSYHAAADNPLILTMQEVDGSKSQSATCTKDGDRLTVLFPEGDEVVFCRTTLGWQFDITRTTLH